MRYLFWLLTSLIGYLITHTVDGTLTGLAVGLGIYIFFAVLGGF